MLDRLRVLATVHPDRLAVDDSRRAVTFAGLANLAEAFATSLAPSTVVASVMPGGPDFTAAHIGTLAAEGTFMPLPHRATRDELRRAFEMVAPDVIALEPSRADVVRAALVDRPGPPPRLVEPHDGAWRHNDGPVPVPHGALPPQTAMVQFTSGSTGRPKGVLLSAQSVAAGIDQNADFLEKFRGTTVFSPMPQFHAMGGAVVLEHLLYGASVLVAHRFVPGDDKRRIEGHAVALLATNPSYVRMLLRLKMLGKLGSVRALSLGSAPSESALLEGIRAAKPDASIHLRYGLSEAFGTLTRLDVAPGTSLPPLGLVGHPLPGIRLAPLPSDDETPHEVRAASPSMAAEAITGPNERTSLLDEQGFLTTGDVGFLDGRGLHLRGRRSQFIKRNGHRIDPSEIEQVLAGHRHIDEATVVGVPDPLAGAKIIAMIEGTAAIDGLDAYCREALSDHKVPQRFVVVDRIPRTPSGKPDRTEVLSQLLKG